MRINDIQLPDNLRDPAALADWLELCAAVADDKNASAAELERELDRLNVSDRESLIGATLLEVDRRSMSMGDGYPFVRNPTYIQMQASLSEYPLYIFCLCLSYFGWTIRKKAPCNPWLLFEEVCGIAAKNYLGGDSLVFGTSSRVGKGAKEKFKSAVASLSAAIGEGDGFRPQKTFSAKDSHLDIVAWKNFSDRRASKIIMFGQCAAGANWTAKLTELEPQNFWDQWMSRGKVSELHRSVFIPHILFDDEEWEKYARAARLLFDRARVVSNAHEDTSSGEIAERLLACCEAEWRIAA